MSEEPTRALDDPGASEELLRLLEGAPELPTMSADLKVEIGARLTEHLATAGAVGATTAGASLLAKILGTNLLPIVGVGMLVGGGIAAYLATNDSEPAEAAGEPVAIISTQEREEPPIREIAEGGGGETPSSTHADGVDPAPAPASPNQTDHEEVTEAPPRSAVPPPAPTDRLTSESALVDRARAQLADAPERALATLAEHERRFPAGQLVAERELLAMEALGRLERHRERRVRAERFLERFPRSPYRQVAEEIIGPDWAAPAIGEL